ncbi:DUF4268 domain-containing protein [bacterium]|nr:DUF4268 domain-containing protein [bacterium]MBU1433445.1 DUF4268 domain-containing protein [bacterium]MBU1503373.1 DUF4268 domain-containing protein [bacterium]
MNLGKLEQVNLRDYWKHEALYFTNWLAQEENLNLLSEEIGIDIILKETEASVGKFNVDILAVEDGSDRLIVIENQLEQTDHDHLGKIITYASGFDAEVIIWIVKDVRDEHKQAIDWLNEHTSDKINFFAIKMELWKIDNSAPAPKFQIISKPNNWAKALKSASSKPARETKLSMLQLEFWTEFKEYLDSHNSVLKTRKPYAQHWYDMSIGNSKAHLSLTIVSQKNSMSTGVYIPDNKELYFKLEENREKIENELNVKFEWMALEGKKASRIIFTKENVNIFNTESWNEYFEWLKTNSENISKVFKKYI